MFEEAEAVHQVQTILAPIVQVPVKGKAEDLAEARWTKKEIFHNNKKLKQDGVLDALNPRYMYPKLGQPYSNWYLNHAQPPIGKWMTTLYGDIPDSFVPSQHHIYTQKELVALAQDSPIFGRQPCPWEVIFQEARSMKNNVHLRAGTLNNVMEMYGD